MWGGLCRFGAINILGIVLREVALFVPFNFDPSLSPFVFFAIQNICLKKHGMGSENVWCRFGVFSDFKSTLSTPARAFLVFSREGVWTGFSFFRPSISVCLHVFFGVVNVFNNWLCGIVL